MAKVSDFVDQIEAVHFSSNELSALENQIHQLHRRALQAELEATARKEPKDLMPDEDDNWGCFTPQNAQERVEFAKARAELDEAGVRLVIAIKDEDVKRAKKIIGEIQGIQSKWSKIGAADTEGRYALWGVIERACCGTDLDPEMFESVM